MESEHLQEIAALSHALWCDPPVATSHSSRTLSAIALVPLNPDRLVERTANTLLQRAYQGGMTMNAAALSEPFYRLLPEERWILCALHRNHWSYERITRILWGDDPLGSQKLQEIAWRARTQLGVTTGPPPRGGMRGLNCPDYIGERPWTQSFLDEQLGPREQQFLQNHLMACAPCRATLNTTRDLYYRVDALLDRLLKLRTASSVEELTSSWTKTRRYLPHRDANFKDSVLVFLDRTDVRWVLVGLLALTLIKLF